MTDGHPSDVVVTPYHRLGRTPAHRWWRPLVGALVMVVLAIVGLTAVFLVGEVVGVAGPADPLVDQAVGFAALATLIPAVLLTAYWVQRRPAGTVSSVLGRLRWRWLARCLLAAFPAAALLIALYAGFEWALGADLVEGARWDGWPRFALASLVALVLVPLQAAGEEYVFRGMIPQLIGSWIASPWPGIVVSAVLFSLAHGVGQLGGGLELVLFGVVTGWLTYRTGGLEAAVALHVANNVLLMFLAAATGALDDEGTAADASWSLLAASALVLPGYAYYLTRAARRVGLAGSSV